MNIAELSIRNKVVTLTFVVLTLAGGMLAYLKLGRLEDPEFTIKSAVVTTQYPGASPMEVADEVTDVIETAIQDMPQLDRVESSNSAGLSVITVTIKDSYNKNTLPQVWDELRRKVGDVQSKLPPGVMPSVVNDSFGDVFGVLFAVSGDGYSWKEMNDYVKYLRKELLLVDGVAKVTVWGDQEEAIFVELSRTAIANLGIGVDSILNTLKYQNLVVSSGAVQVGPKYVRISPTGEFATVEDVAALQIHDPSSGKVVALKDVASVTRGIIDPPKWIMRHNGKPSVAVGVSVVPGGNVPAMGEAIRKRLLELEEERPIGMKVDTVNYQPEDVTEAVKGFADGFFEAVAIVIVVLLIFMGVRSGFLIGGVLALTVSASCIGLYLWGVNLERISLGALIIALGMLVDDAIVVTEGMMVRIEGGMNRLAAAKDIVGQNLMPLLGATVISVLAFAAIGVSDDSTGEFCRSLFQVMLISLMLSWVIAATVTPLFCTMFFKSTVSHTKEAKDPYGGFIFVTYRKFLRLCIKHRFITVASVIAMMAGGLFLFTHLKNSFFPDSNRAQFTVSYRLPAGTDIRKTASDIAELEKHLLEDERIVSADSFIGSGAPRFMLTFSPETDGDKGFGLILVRVKDYQSIDSLMPEVIDYASKNLPDATVTAGKIALGPSSGAVQARFSGPDPKILRHLSNQAKAYLRQVDGAYAVRDNWKPKVDLLRPQYDESKARQAGVTRSDLARALEMNFTGQNIGVYRERDELIPIVLRQPEAERLGVDNMRNVQVYSTVNRKTVPVEQVVSGFTVETEDSYVRDRNRKFTITAECDKRPGVLASTLFNEVRANIENISLPPGYEMEWGGEFENSTRAQGKIAAKMPMVLIFMMLIIVMLFNSIKQTLIIWTAVPLTIVGVALGLYIFDLSFDFMSLLGFLSLMGMQIKAAIVLIDQIKVDLDEGKKPFDAVLDSAVSRMRPVFMSAFTASVGVIPLLKDGFFRSMSVTIMFGLLFATLLTLIVVPVSYCMFYRIAYEPKQPASPYISK
jgi:multidrug efflux pump subunit AcrB